MSFAKRFVAIRKERNLTQAQMAALTGVHLSQIKRYEQGDGEPSMGVIRKFAKSLNVSADELVFDEDERGPRDDLRYEFEAISQFDEESKETARQLILALIHQHHSKQLIQRSKQSA